MADDKAVERIVEIARIRTVQRKIGEAMFI
jgi:hypothetical protein